MDKISLIASTENVDKIIDFAAEKLSLHNVDSKIIINIRIALDEILSNIVNYGYKDKNGDITLSISFTNDMIEITIEDQGIPFNPLKVDDPQLNTSLKERQIGGLGIYITKKIMDNVEYDYLDNKNILRIKKIRG